MTKLTETGNTDFVSYNHNESALLGCIERLEVLLQEEENIIATGWPFDLDDINNRKAHLLHEFSQLSRNANEHSSARLEERLGAVIKRAARNAFMLEQYFLAIQEISRLMVENVKKEDSDGTYSRRRTSWRYDIEG
jgi:hypothetical protein